MKGLIADANVQGQVEYLVLRMQANAWADFWQALGLALYRFGGKTGTCRFDRSQGRAVPKRSIAFPWLDNLRAPRPCRIPTGSDPRSGRRFRGNGSGAPGSWSQWSRYPPADRRGPLGRQGWHRRRGRRGPPGTPRCRTAAQNSAALMTASVERARCRKPLLRSSAKSSRRKLPTARMRSSSRRTS